jgi:hypothetical protein
MAQTTPRRRGGKFAMLSAAAGFAYKNRAQIMNFVNKRRGAKPPPKA